MTPLRVQSVKIRRLSPGAFAPYGRVLAPRIGAVRKKLAGAEEWETGFAADGSTEVLLVRFKFAPWRFHVMERHTAVTQSFFSLGGQPFIMVVAPPAPSGRSERVAVPQPHDVRAFVTDGMQGVLMWMGTWHSVYRYPVSPPHVDIVALTSVETTEDLLGAGDSSGQPFVGVTRKGLSERVDYATEHGVAFELIW